MTKKAAEQTMDARIAAAFAADATSADVSILLAEVEAAASVAEAGAEAARARALDPLLSQSDARHARETWDDAEFQRDRLREAARKLSDRAAELKALEAERNARAEHQRVLTERNRLAGEMERMAEPVAQISSLVSEIDLFDRQVKSFNLANRVGHIRPILSGDSSILEIVFGGWPRVK